MKQTGQSRKKELAVAALLTSTTIDGAAANIGVSARTLKYWLKDDAFRKLLQDARREVIGGVTNQLRCAMSAAASKLIQIMGNKKAPLHLQLQAASKIIELGLDAHWMEDIERRIAELERLQQEEHKR